MKVTILRDSESDSINVILSTTSAYKLSMIKLPESSGGKIENKDFFKFLVDLEHVLNRSIQSIEVAKFLNLEEL